MIMWSLPRKTQAVSKSLLNKVTSSTRPGFTLVEVVIALGIFSFCIISVLGLMQVALASSRDSQTDSSISSLVSNLSARLGSLDSNSVFFDRTGMPVQTNAMSSAYFRASLTPVDPAAVASTFGLTNGNSLQVWSVSIGHPSPAYGQTFRIILGGRKWR